MIRCKLCDGTINIISKIITEYDPYSRLDGKIDIRYAFLLQCDKCKTVSIASDINKFPDIKEFEEKRKYRDKIIEEELKRHNYRIADEKDELDIR